MSMFKLEKLKIQAFRSAARRPSDAIQPTFVAMFNPATIQQTYCIPWGKKRGLNESAPVLRYAGSNAGQLTLTLVLDGTGVHEAGLLGATQKTVAARVDELFAVAHRYNGTIHEPNYLRVVWGTLSFDCRLSSVDVKYTTFDRNGTPLRAELTVKLLADVSAHTRARLEAKQSPDVTHTRTVMNGDTLPLLSKEIYGSPSHYLFVARHNQLDDFRRLKPGTELEFPPLVASIRERDRSEGD